MSRLYIRVMTGFYTHRKTAKLRAKIGSDANWIPPRLWAYAAENQPNGNMSGYSSEEIAELLGCLKHSKSMLQALIDCGFVDKNGMIHDWYEWNSYHDRFAVRAKTAALARWSKSPPAPPLEKQDEKGKGKGESGVSMTQASFKHTTSILQASEIAPFIGEKGNSVELVDEIYRRLGVFYHREANSRHSYAEEHAIVEISKRPNARNEVGEIEAYHEKEKKFFPRSLATLVNDWEKFLDSARVWRPEESNKNSGNNRISKERELDRIMKELSNYSHHLSDYDKFSSARRRIEKLRAKRDTLREELGVIA